ncbi:MAG: sterol desaturase family protein, partial [Phycisphaeraceae bacterium]|nr:sterol desaturase family protein [Phycisphaeraceae bacterium]
MHPFEKLLTDHAETTRLGIFLGLLVLFGILEFYLPRRKRHEGKKTLRWVSNLGLSVTNSLMLRFAFPLLAIGVSQIAKENGWGVFNAFEVPYVVAFIGTLVVFDLVIYLQHLVFHYVPVLWRLHRVHHTDVDLDVTSAVRFHFVEIALSMGIKMAVTLALGAPALAILVFEIWLSAVAMFHHANLPIPSKVDRILRWFIVTPDMHRVHHSVRTEETNSNFSFNWPGWDRIFGTYTDQPREGHEGMRIGLEEFRDDPDQRIDRLLVLPMMNRHTETPPSHGST